MPRKKSKERASHSKSEYDRYRQNQPEEFQKDTFKTVPLHHTNYTGNKFKWWKRKDSGAKAIVGKKKKSNKWSIQSILIPKKKKYPFSPTRSGRRKLTKADKVYKKQRKREEKRSKKQQSGW